MLYRAKEFQLDIRGSVTDCISFGTGTKPLIMIQGLSTRSIKGSAAALALMYRIFAQKYTVYLFDRRRNLPESITVRELASDTAFAMDALGLHNADILGVSQGGMIAQYLAIDRPDLVHRMVLAVTLSQNNETAVSVIRHWTEMASQGSMKELIADMTEKMYSDSYAKRYRPFLPLLTVLQKPRDVRRFLILAESCLSCRAYDELDKIQCPVLVIGGRQDKVVGGNSSEEIAGKLGCALHMYEDLGHAAYEEARDFNRRVLAFLQE